MTKLLLTMSLGLILNISPAFAGGEKVLNVFYDGTDTGEFAANIVTSTNSTTFMRTNKIVMVSKKVEGCRFGCEVRVKRIDEYSFEIVSKEKTVGKFEVNDPDGLLPISAFALTNVNDKLRLLFDLERLNSELK